jgi:hypothetical protein
MYKEKLTNKFTNRHGALYEAPRQFNAKIVKINLNTYDKNTILIPVESIHRRKFNTLANHDPNQPNGSPTSRFGKRGRSKGKVATGVSFQLDLGFENGRSAGFEFEKDD